MTTTSKPSETPRTDARWKLFETSWRHAPKEDLLRYTKDFARKLERKLAIANSEIESLKNQLGDAYENIESLRASVVDSELSKCLKEDGL